MIDMIQALELLEICADEMASEHEDVNFDRTGVNRTTQSLAARALAVREMSIAQLGSWPVPVQVARPAGPALSIGALIVFRTAHRFWRAGASTERTLSAVYCAASRYADAIPDSLQDDVDKLALGELMAGPVTFAEVSADSF
jgi:hypothetical protein